MHFHHYALKHLADYLNRSHAGEPVYGCFSQSRNELLVELETNFIRIGCHTPLTYVAPVQDFAKARKNVVDLFPELIGLAFQKARVIPWERVLILEFENQYDLVLKMHGIRANVILRHAGMVIALFKKDLEADLNFEENSGPYDPEALHRQELPADADIKQVLMAQRQVSPIYDKPFAEKINGLISEGEPFRAAFEKVVHDADDQVYFLRKEAQKIRLYLFEPQGGGEIIQVKGISQALLAFISAHFQFDTYRKLYLKAQKDLEKPYSKIKKVYNSYQRGISQLETERNPEEIGHLIMANLHAIEAGTTQVELEDFYTGGKTSVRLKEKLNPQDNAKRYYDKHKQRKAKLKYLKSQLEDLEEKVSESEAEIQKFHSLPTPESLEFLPNGFDSREIRKYKKELRGLLHEQEKEAEERSPFRTYSRSNYDIFVGRNARNNDLLSFKFANKQDIWLHAKDVTGSHVIIRTRPGQNLPQPVLEYAAGLAAWFSKRKNDGLVPVSYTPRKFIRKRKGDPAGMVVVEREEVILVEPVKA